MVVAWLLFPLVLLAVCLGCGLAIERLSGRLFSGAILPALGLATVIVIATLTTDRSATAPFTTPAVVAVALAGYATSWSRLRRLRPDPWMSAVAIVIYGICAAPVVLSGNATFLGYFVDTDPAVHLELANWLTTHGRSLSSVHITTPSSTLGVVGGYLGTAYPAGADVGLGAVRPLVGQDIAWIFQPYMACAMALGAILINELLTEVVRLRPLRAVCAVIAAQPGLAYAFYLEGSIKEIVIVPLITLTVVLVVRSLGWRPFRLHDLVPLIVAVVAGLDVYSLTIVPWIGLPLAIFTGTIGWRNRKVLRTLHIRPRPLRFRRSAIAWRRAAAHTIGFILVALVLVPVASGASTFFAVASSVLGQGNTLGNLAAPLSKWESFGIWPNGDFRFPALPYRIALVLIGIGVAGFALGALWLIRRRAVGPLLFLLGDGIATIYLLSRATPYAASKVLMIASIAVVLTAMLGAVGLHQSGRRVEGYLLAAAIAAGIGWTNFLAYHDSSIAPQARFRELAAIGTRFRSRGPAFYNLWDTLPAYFLRNEWVFVSDAFGGPAPLLPGAPAYLAGQTSDAWDPNLIDQTFLRRYPLLVLGRSPVTSRPPADYRLVFQGHYYDVWERASFPRVLAHLSLSYGNVDPPPAVSCQAIIAASARAARDHARLAYVARASLPELMPTRAIHPSGWAPTSGSPGPTGILSLGQNPGALVGTVHVPAPGSYQVWIEGSFSRPLTVYVGRRLVASISHQIGTIGQFLLLGRMSLPAGDQSVLIVSRRSYRPGNVAGGEFLGPLVLAHDPVPPPVQELTSGQSPRSLCGKPLEWVEVVS